MATIPSDDGRTKKKRKRHNVITVDQKFDIGDDDYVYLDEWDHFDIDKDDYDVIDEIIQIQRDNFLNCDATAGFADLWDIIDIRDCDKDCRVYKLKIPRSLSVLPRSILNLDALEILDLKNSFVPPWIGELQGLKELYLPYNLFENNQGIWTLVNLEKFAMYAPPIEVPRSIGNFKNLKHLTLMVSNVPDEIGNLTQLQTLMLSGVASLPSSIGNLTMLTKLTLGVMMSWTKTQLSRLPSSIGNLTNLKYLKIELDNLRALPDSIGDLINLEVLQIIDSRKIASLPSSIGNLKKLTDLVLVYLKKLTAIPDSIGSLHNLKRLSLEYSGIVSIPASIGNLRNLNKLTLNRTKDLKSLPGEIQNLTRLEILELHTSGIVSFPGFYEKITTTSINCLSTGSLDLGVFRNMKNLRVLDLHNTVIETHTSYQKTLLQLVLHLPMLECVGPLGRFAGNNKIHRVLWCRKVRSRMLPLQAENSSKMSLPSLSLWPLVLEKKTFTRDLSKLYDCHCCRRYVVNQYSPLDAVFLLLVEYGAVILD